MPVSGWKGSEEHERPVRLRQISVTSRTWNFIKNMEFFEYKGVVPSLQTRGNDDGGEKAIHVHVLPGVDLGIPACLASTNQQKNAARSRSS